MGSGGLSDRRGVWNPVERSEATIYPRIAIRHRHGDSLIHGHGLPLGIGSDKYGLLQGIPLQQGDSTQIV